MSDKLKNLTSKNPKDFEQIAYNLINTPDVELFAELVENDEFLFDFVKQNVAKRLEKYCNKSNFRNLILFLKYYSPFYEDFIISNLVKYADEDLTDEMLNLFDNGTVEEKIYCAKFFSYIKDPIALENLKKYAFDNDSRLSTNCALALSAFNDLECYEKALKMLDSEDVFLHIPAVKFLVSFGKINALSKIIDAAKKSSFSENIAGEIPYLCDLFELYNKNRTDCLYIVNLIINSLGELINLSQVFDFRLYDFFEMLIKSDKNSQIAVVLLNANDKFSILTENDEYLYDETKDTKQEINDIKTLLKSMDISELYAHCDEELQADSLFVYTALEFTENEEKVRNLLQSSNQTVVLRALEVLKQLEALTLDDKEKALNYVQDENIKSIIMAI